MWHVSHMEKHSLLHAAQTARCRRPWSEMPGNDRVRTCTSCKLSVIDPQAMSEDELAKLVAEINEREWRKKTALAIRGDGRVMVGATGSDCIRWEFMQNPKVDAAYSLVVYTAIYWFVFYASSVPPHGFIQTFSMMTAFTVIWFWLRKRNHRMAWGVAALISMAPLMWGWYGLVASFSVDQLKLSFLALAIIFVVVERRHRFQLIEEKKLTDRTLAVHSDAE